MRSQEGELDLMYSSTKRELKAEGVHGERPISRVEAPRQNVNSEQVKVGGAGAEDQKLTLSEPILPGTPVKIKTQRKKI